MTIRARFRKALFSFFKDEILKEVKNNTHSTAVQTVVHSELNFKELRFEFQLKEDRQSLGRPAFLEYEDALMQARKRLFEETMKYMIVDSRSVLDPGLYDHRVFKAKIYVADNLNPVTNKPTIK